MWQIYEFAFSHEKNVAAKKALLLKNFYKMFTEVLKVFANSKVILFANTFCILKMS
jgi:hypothetical protein